jgi:hypothetical protein
MPGNPNLIRQGNSTRLSVYFFIKLAYLAGFLAVFALERPLALAAIAVAPTLLANILFCHSVAVAAFTARNQS